MATGTAGDQARNQHRQVLNTWRKQINFGDPSNGVAVAQLVLPQGSFIVGVYVEIVTAFDGGAALIVGTNGAVNNIVAAADVNEGVAGVTEVTRSYGRSLAAAADVTISTKLTSAAPTVGQAELVVLYEGNNG